MTGGTENTYVFDVGWSYFLNNKMRLKEAGKILRLHPYTLRRKIYAGLLGGTLIPREKGIGGHEYYEITEKQLEEYVKSNDI